MLERTSLKVLGTVRKYCDQATEALAGGNVCNCSV